MEAISEFAVLRVIQFSTCLRFRENLIEGRELESEVGTMLVNDRAIVRAPRTHSPVANYQFFS